MDIHYTELTLSKTIEVFSFCAAEIIKFPKT
jgi:hypothetical protein